MPAPRQWKVAHAVILWILGLTCWLGSLLPVSASPSPQKADASKAAWTLMVYQDADNSLETPILDNLKEMLKVGSTAKVQIVVLCDRSPKSEPKDQYTDEAIGGLPDWKGARLLHVEKDHLKSLADWGDTNMGDPATLKRFVEAASKAYPADHYGLIVTDHGSGWTALCADESSDDASMTLRDLRGALQPFVAAHGKIDLVGLDVCLMGNFETAQALAPVAHAMVGSEELAPARGWNYDMVLKGLTDNPEMTALQLGRAIVDDYTIYFREEKDPALKFESVASTLSLLDLDQIGPLQDALNALADRCMETLRGKQHSGWVKVAQARAKAEEYGVLDTHDGGGEQMHDLIQLVELLEQSGEPPVVDAAKNVEIAAKHLVRYLMRGPCRPHAGGISIYFPIEGIDLHGDPDGEAYLTHTFASEAHWASFLALYSVAVNDFSEKPTLNPIEATGMVASLEKPVELHSQTPNDDIDKAYVMILGQDGNDHIVLGRMPTRVVENGRIGQRFNGLWFMLTDKKKLITCPITDFEAVGDTQSAYLAYVSAQIRRQGQPKWTDVCLVFFIQTDPTPHGTLVHAIADTKEGPLRIALQKGDQLRPVFQCLTANGLVNRISDEPRGFINIEDPQDFSIAWGLVSKGLYTVGFEVIGLGGESSLAFTEVTLE